MGYLSTLPHVYSAVFENITISHILPKTRFFAGVVLEENIGGGARQKSWRPFFSRRPQNRPKLPNQPLQPSKKRPLYNCLLVLLLHTAAVTKQLGARSGLGCMECRRGLAMGILSVRPSVCPSLRLSNACIVTKRKKNQSSFLYHTSVLSYENHLS